MGHRLVKMPRWISKSSIYIYFLYNGEKFNYTHNTATKSKNICYNGLFADTLRGVRVNMSCHLKISNLIWSDNTRVSSSQKQLQQTVALYLKASVSSSSRWISNLKTSSLALFRVCLWSAARILIHFRVEKRSFFVLFLFLLCDLFQHNLQ